MASVNTGSSGKGSGRRKTLVSEEKAQAEWDRIFGKKKDTVEVHVEPEVAKEKEEYQIELLTTYGLLLFDVSKVSLRGADGNSYELVDNVTLSNILHVAVGMLTLVKKGDSNGEE